MFSTALTPFYILTSSAQGSHYYIFSPTLVIFWLLFLIMVILIDRRRQWHPTPVLLPGKSHGWKSLLGYSPWGRKESDTTEQPHFHFSLSCTGEGNGNPLQCSCLENPRDRRAWWAAIYGATQSWTRLKRLSSSSSSCTAGGLFTVCATREASEKIV